MKSALGGFGPCGGLSKRRDYCRMEAPASPISPCPSPPAVILRPRSGPGDPRRLWKVSQESSRGKLGPPVRLRRPEDDSVGVWGCGQQNHVLQMFPTMYYVYILASQRNGTLYTGVTGRLVGRVSEHKQKLTPGFTSRYG